MAEPGLGNKPGGKINQSRVKMICNVYCSVDDEDPICKFNKEHNTEISCPFFSKAKRKYYEDTGDQIINKYYGVK